MKKLVSTLLMSGVFCQVHLGDNVWSCAEAPILEKIEANPPDVDHLLDGDFEGFFDGLRSLFAHLPYGEKGYATPYLADGRPVYLIGLAFDSKTRQLVDAAWERGGSFG